MTTLRDQMIKWGYLTPTLEEMKKKLDPSCRHNFAQIGLWDGEDKESKPISPIAQCLKCKGARYFTQEEWGREVGSVILQGGDPAIRIIQVRITKEWEQEVTEELRQAYEDYISPTEHAIMTRKD
ncbi:MAG: hypothetical protein Q7R84_02260 [bacterium]|nr:hypothetical protein [bacterium]